MDELYKMLKGKLNEMRNNSDASVRMTFDEISRMYQMVCMMRQIKEITDWCDAGHS